MNVKLLRRVAQTIVRRYKQIDMNHWFDPREGAGRCNTTACIAGWAETLSHEKEFKGTVKPRQVAKLFNKDFGRFMNRRSRLMSYTVELSNREKEKVRRSAIKRLELTRAQAKRLFFSDQWPEQFADDCGRLRASIDATDRLSPGTPEYAKRVAERIEHFIATKGRE